jgi:hypothetical protein
MPPVQKDELQDLIDHPNETLEVEYKDWLDLADSNEARASLARHIAAIANHGGGNIVFGFTDAMESAGVNRFPKVIYDRDLVSGIVKKYLEPTFQCNVQIVRSTGGNDHPIIIVPPHGAAPICAKADGPLVGGKPKGIIHGVYYTRKPGPESAPILTAAEWAPIMRRCAMHERTSILSAIDQALRGSNTNLATLDDRLKIWHDAARSAFLTYAAASTAPPGLAKNFLQLSYAVERADGQKLDPARLIDVLREVNAEVHDLVRTGWSMFYPFSPTEIAPYFTTDANAGVGQDDFVETALLRDKNAGAKRFPDMWRVSTDGMATIIRNYWEDDPPMADAAGVNPGAWLSPNMMVRSLAELVRHSRGMAERFNAPTVISFRCEWRGLNGRTLHDPWSFWAFREATSKTDHRITTGSWPISALINNWPEAVAELGKPLLRLFTTQFELTADWVRGQAPKWLQ